MLELLNDKEVMDDYVLGKMIRYNHRYRLQDESVAAHSFFVSLFCLKIMAKLNLSHEIERQVLIMAALHDTAESRTSDIPHDVKNRYPEMKSILDRIEQEYYIEHWEKYISAVYNPDEMVYNIIKLADAYSVYQYCINENTLGNMSDEMSSIKSEALVRITNHTKMINAIIEKEA